MSMTPEEERELRARQKSRSVILALLLGFLAVLFFAITIVKMGMR